MLLCYLCEAHVGLIDLWGSSLLITFPGVRRASMRGTRQILALPSLYFLSTQESFHWPENSSQEFYKSLSWGKMSIETILHIDIVLFQSRKQIELWDEADSFDYFTIQTNFYRFCLVTDQSHLFIQSGVGFTLSIRSTDLWRMFSAVGSKCQTKQCW